MSSIELANGEAWFDDTRALGSTRLSTTLRRIAASLGKLLGLVLLLGLGLAIASSLVPERTPLALPPQSALAAFSEIRRPMPMFALTGTDFTRLPLAYTAFRAATGTARRDTLTFGEPRGDGAWLKLSLDRTGAEPALSGDLVKEVETLGRETDVTLSHVAAPTSLSTRFGPFEAADLRVQAASGSTPCLGFRSLPVADGPLRILGLVCGAAARPIGRDLLGCIIDRIDLLTAGDDRILRDFFVAAERRRGAACQPSPLFQAGSRTTWLDANGSAPILRDVQNRGEKKF